jgi:hypothetical protein
VAAQAGAPLEPWAGAESEETGGRRRMERGAGGNR